MATTIHREEQRPRSWGIILLLGLFSALSLYRLTNIGLARTWSGWDLTLTLALTATLGIAWYLFSRSRLRIKLNTKSLKIRARHLLQEKYKLRLDEIEDLEFVDVPFRNRWNGELANPATSRLRKLDFGDRRGVFIRMNDGREFLIFSDELYEQRGEMENLVRKRA
ncbi:MAG: hypothetical protein WBA17_15310 [Saprospiraceae bacterium]